MLERLNSNIERWEETQKNIGVVFVNRPVKIVFNSIEELDIDSIKPSCYCLTARYIKEKKTLIVTYTPSDIPQSRKIYGFKSYNSEKYVRVVSNGSRDILRISCIVKEVNKS